LLMTARRPVRCVRAGAGRRLLTHVCVLVNCGMKLSENPD
jgi:hypothetical protein